MKTTVLFIVLMAGSLFSYGQKPLKLGIKGGYTSSEITTKLDFDESRINNYIAGAFLRINMKKMYLQPEAYFTSKGGKLKATDFSNQFDLKTIDVPVLLGAKVIGLGIANVRVNAGPVVSFVTDKDIKAQSEQLVNSKLKDNLWGLQYGIGVDVLNFTLDARMENSLSNVLDGGDKSRSKLFLLTLGFFLF